MATIRSLSAAVSAKRTTLEAKACFPQLTSLHPTKVCARVSQTCTVRHQTCRSIYKCVQTNMGRPRRLFYARPRHSICPCSWARIKSAGPSISLTCSNLLATSKETRFRVRLVSKCRNTTSLCLQPPLPSKIRLLKMSELSNRVLRVWNWEARTLMPVTWVSTCSAIRKRNSWAKCLLDTLTWKLHFSVPRGKLPATTSTSTRVSSECLLLTEYS